MLCVALNGAPRAESPRAVVAAADRGAWREAGMAAEASGEGGLLLYQRWRWLLEAKPRPPFSAYAAFLREQPDWPGHARLRARGEATIGPDVTPSQRLAYFGGDAPRTREGRVALAQALSAGGRGDRAAALVRQSWVEDGFGKAEEQAFLDRFDDVLRPADQAARLDRLLWDGDLGAARRMLSRVGPDARALARARLTLQLSAPEVEAAIEAVPAALRRDPGLSYDRLRWRQRRGLEAGVREILLDPPERLGRAQAWWPEQQRAIREAIRQRSHELAYRLAARHRQTGGVAFAEAEWLAGWLALRFAEAPGTAAEHFLRLWRNVGTPISRARAAYWLGRSFAAMGERRDAATWFERAATFPTTFYGQLAAAESGLEVRDLVDAVPKAAARTRAALQERAPAQLARLLCRSGEARASLPFFRHLGETAGSLDELRAVQELAQSCSRADLALAAARAAAGNGAVLASEAFPLPAVPALRVRGQGRPEPAVLLALARQESLFDPAARSPAGALGLMQLLPSTARLVARRAGLAFDRGRLTGDPGYSVELGGRYLQAQLDRFGGEPILALAAYNAGPGRVAQWLEQNGDPRGDDFYGLVDWIELIPFAETRNYVMRVLEGRDVYRALLAGPRPTAARASAELAPLPRPKPAS